MHEGLKTPAYESLHMVRWLGGIIETGGYWKTVETSSQFRPQSDERGTQRWLYESAIIFVRHDKSSLAEVG